jgi:hypothetical protein
LPTRSYLFRSRFPRSQNRDLRHPFLFIEILLSQVSKSRPEAALSVSSDLAFTGLKIET